MTRNTVLFFTGLVWWALWTTIAVAQEVAQETDASDIQQRREALDWLDTHVGDQQLLKPEDFQALFDKVKNMSDAEFQTWLAKTRQLRRALQSQAWRQTRAWLREFLAVQAIYTPEEIDHFRSQAAGMSPPELLEAMRLIRRKHQSLISAHAASEEARRMNLHLRDDLIRRQQLAAQQTAAMHAAGSDQLYGRANTGPVRSSYAQRMNVYRRFGFWPGGGFAWWIW